MRKLGALPHGWLGEIASTDAGDGRPFLIPGVRVKFDPIGRKAVRAARAACQAALAKDGDFQEASDALSAEMLRFGIVEWEGVGDLAGDVVGVTPEAVGLFIADPDLCEAAEIVYVRPWVLRDMEKNVSAGSPNGTSGVVTPAPGTATKSASGAPTAGARRTRKPKTKMPAKAATTSPTSPKPKQARKSGK